MWIETGKRVINLDNVVSITLYEQHIKLVTAAIEENHKGNGDTLSISINFDNQDTAKRSYHDILAQIKPIPVGGAEY